MDSVNFNSNTSSNVSYVESNEASSRLGVRSDIFKSNSAENYAQYAAGTTNQNSFLTEVAEKIRTIRTDIARAGLGIGIAASEFLNNNLPTGIAPKVQIFGRNIYRVGGAALSAMTLAPSVYSAYKADKELGNASLYNTRKEFVSGVGSIAAGAAIGKLGAVGLTALAGMGVGTSILIGGGVLVAGGVIYGSIKAKNFISSIF